MAARIATCRCGHSLQAHEHLRKGRDCAVCEPGACERFSPDARERLALLGSRLSGVFHRAGTPPAVLRHPSAGAPKPAQPLHPGHEDDAREA